MLHKKPSGIKSIVSYSILIPLLFMGLYLVSCTEESISTEVSKDNVEQKQGIRQTADKMPEFPGGQQALFKFLGENIVYPSQAKEKQIEDTVHVRFVIREDGTVDDVQSIKEVHPLLEEAAINTVESMPKWTPAEHDGKKVAVEYMLPIRFALN